MGMKQITIGSAKHYADLVETDGGKFKCYGVDGEPWPVDEFGEPLEYNTEEEAVSAFLKDIVRM